MTVLASPHFTPRCRLDPTGVLNKEDAAKDLVKWQVSLPVADIVSFSDGSEQNIEGTRHVDYDYVICRGSARTDNGSGFLDPKSYVFDAGAIGASCDLERAAQFDPDSKIYS